MEIVEALFKVKPYKHQLECLQKFGGREHYALLADMGTGKTWIIINEIALLYNQGLCDAVLVFAPNGVHYNWTRLELPKTMPIAYRSYAWTASKAKKEISCLENIMQPGGLRIFTMNWEALQNSRGFAAAERFAKTTNNLMIVCDESDAIKNPNAKRTKSLFKLRKYSKYRRIMTGTPITNSPFDAFSQFGFLHPDILETRSYFAFKTEYGIFLPSGHPLVDNIRRKTGARRTPMIAPKEGPKYKNLHRLSALMAPHSFRVTKEECLDLPAKIYKTVLFDLTSEQKKVYQRVLKECRLQFDGKESVLTKLTAISKLAQITSGYYLHPESDVPVKIPGKNPKLETLLDRLPNKKTIIWARFRAEIQDIVRALHGKSVVELHGGISKKKRIEAIEAFERGDAHVLVGNQQAGGTGITLTAAECVIYFSNDFSLRNRLQSEDRAHRIGQTKNVVYINLAGRGTIDERVIRALMAKKNIADTLMEEINGL